MGRMRAQTEAFQRIVRLATNAPRSS
jgi:hypothetical protein